jgi:MFS family permease
MGKDLLGPVREPGRAAARGILHELGVVAVGLAAGLRYVSRRRGPAAALGATGGNRILYGILFLMSILLYRNDFYHGASPGTAETHYGYLVTVVAVGYFCAALVTPRLTTRLTKSAVMALLLAGTAVVVGGFGETFSQPTYLVMGFCLGLAGQGIAICSTTILQEDLADDYRGRAFSLYDMMFNITFAAGALVSVPFMPLSGKSHALLGVVAVGYAVVAAAYWLAVRRPPAAAAT